MTDKELRKLGRMELIDIIYQLEKKQEELQKENEALQSRLDSVRITIDEAGSIAEAAVGINGVFEAAQKAADQYLAEIHMANSETEQRCNLILSEAEQKAAHLIEQAENEVLRAKHHAKNIIADADDQIEKKWCDFISKTEQVLKAHAELQSSMNNLSKRG